MRILYIDTTTRYLYTGIVEDDNLLVEVKEDFGTDLSKVTLKNISEMLDSVSLKPSDIDKIIVVNGPGSYTGIRIGVTIAKTFAFSLKKEITTISSLEAMAVSSRKDTDYIIPIIDARRGYSFGAIYDKNYSPILKEQYIKTDTLHLAIDNLPGSYTVIGSCLGVTEEYNPDILKIVNVFKNKEGINPHSVNPIYLKLTEAEEKKNVEVI